MPRVPLNIAARAATHRAVMGSVFGGLSRVGRLAPFAHPRWHTESVTRDVVYGPCPEHRLDVYRPRQPGLRPAVLYIHGGAFCMLSKDSHWSIALTFARAGYTVFNVNYRLAPRHPYPAALEDVARAYAFVLDQAGEFGIDSQRVAVAGESAGANLATALAAMTCFARPEPFARSVFERGVVPPVVVPACGVLQASDMARFARRRPLSTFVRRQLEDVELFYLHRSRREATDTTLADPLLLLESSRKPERPLPPFFIPIGTADPLLDDSRRLGAALARRDVEHRVAFYEGEVHAFHALLWRKRARACWRDTFAFMAPHIRSGYAPRGP